MRKMNFIMPATVCAALLLSSPASRAAAPAAGIPDLEPRLEACAACHGKQGRSDAEAYYPSIAGKPADYLYQQLRNFRDGRREQPVMERMLSTVSDSYLLDMARHYAAQAPAVHTRAGKAAPAELARGRQLAEQGDEARKIPSCASCHGDSLAGVEPSIPGLLGLPEDYLKAQLGAWRSGTRRALAPDCMQQVAERLTPADIAAVATWIASRPPEGRRAAPRAVRVLPLDCGALIAAVAPTPPAPPGELVARGQYLVTAGNCIACHTAPGGAEYAGNRRIPTPYGDVWSSNLTPDPDTGLGRWTAEDFARALHEGRSRDGRLLSPAFPYTNYTRVSAADAAAMYAYLMSLPPVRNPARPSELRWPYSTQAALAAWRWLYFEPGEFQPRPDRSPRWNRGAYLVEGLGHCNACHTGRNWLGGLRAEIAYGGGPIPMLGWDALPLTSARPLKEAEAADMVELLHAGSSRRDVTTGPMAEVVWRSLQHLERADVEAMVEYLRSLPHHAAPAVSYLRVPESAARQLRQRGLGLYKEHCADCHGAGGEGREREIPALAGNALVTSPSPTNAIQTVMYGGFGPSTRFAPQPWGMPPYAHRLPPEDIAAVLSYVRGSWGNAAPAVSPAEVSRQ